MATPEGQFPKVGNDPIYASEMNTFGVSGIVSFTGARTIIHFGTQNISQSTTDQVVFTSPFGATPRITLGQKTDPGGAGGEAPWISNSSTGSFGIRNPNAGTNLNVDWIAIGTE